MENMIYRALLEKSKTTRSNGNYSFDLDMKNGDELRVFLPNEPIARLNNETYKTKDYSILDNTDNVIHFTTLNDIATWISDNY